MDIVGAAAIIVVVVVGRVWDLNADEVGGAARVRDALRELEAAGAQEARHDGTPVDRAHGRHSGAEGHREALSWGAR